MFSCIHASKRFAWWGDRFTVAFLYRARLGVPRAVHVTCGGQGAKGTTRAESGSIGRGDAGAAVGDEAAAAHVGASGRCVRRRRRVRCHPSAQPLLLLPPLLLPLLLLSAPSAVTPQGDGGDDGSEVATDMGRSPTPHMPQTPWRGSFRKVHVTQSHWPPLGPSPPPLDPAGAKATSRRTMCGALTGQATATPGRPPAHALSNLYLTTRIHARGAGKRQGQVTNDELTMA